MEATTRSVDCRIRVLPDLLIRKIAAGEVVERPASVVKELLENAVDAGATRIAVTIEGGGKDLIRVADDGCGMSQEELRLAVRPHATSKIVEEDDLFSIATMGFRGEALASISSVSKLRVVSRPEGSPDGHEMCVAADEVESQHAAGCNVGTTVEVRDLFFNVPARRKFLRTPSTEMGHINEQLARIALANPQIAFEMVNNGRTTQNLPVCKTRLERIAKFYGPELASALMTTHRDERGMVLEAYVAPPAQSRATTQWQYTYVNGRYIRDRFIQHAIKEAFRGLTEPNRHGVTFVFLTVDPAEVDVNVHPTKIEVRWVDSRLIHSQVLSALRELFQTHDLSPALRASNAAEPIDSQQQDRIRREMADLLTSTPPVRSGSPAGEGATLGARSFGPGGAGEMPGGGTSMDGERMWRSLYGSPSDSAGTHGEADPAVTHGQSDPAGPGGSQIDGAPDSPRPRAVQMHNLYLVAETQEGIIIVDQHALHERVLYEQLRERMTTGALESQRLLLPESLRVTAEQVALLESKGDLLKRLGLEVTPFGTDTVAVHAFPSLLKDTDVVAFVTDLLDFLAQQPGETPADALIDHVLSMMACKAAVKAGDPLEPEEIDALFQRRDLIDKGNPASRSSSCPHGRPTVLRLSKADLNRQFHRT